MPRALAFAIAISTLPPAAAQMNMAGHVMEMQDEFPPEMLPPPARLSGIGNAHMDITATAEAQMWFTWSASGVHHARIDHPFSQLITHGIPNSSVTTAKRAAQNVSCSGIWTVPFAASRPKIRSASAGSVRLYCMANPCGF